MNLSPIRTLAVLSEPEIDAFLSPEFWQQFLAITGHISPAQHALEMGGVSDRTMRRLYAARHCPQPVAITPGRRGVSRRECAEFTASPARWRALHGAPLPEEIPFAKALRAEATERGIIQPDDKTAVA